MGKKTEHLAMVIPLKGVNGLVHGERGRQRIVQNCYIWISDLFLCAWNYPHNPKVVTRKIKFSEYSCGNLQERGHVLGCSMSYQEDCRIGLDRHCWKLKDDYYPQGKPCQRQMVHISGYQCWVTWQGTNKETPSMASQQGEHSLVTNQQLIMQMTVRLHDFATGPKSGRYEYQHQSKQRIQSDEL